MTTITREFTKEQLIEKAKENVEFFRERLDLMPQSQHVALSLHLAEITLASLEAEPVFFITVEGDDWIQAGRIPGSQFDFNNLPDGVVNLYAAPPAPAVPEEATPDNIEVLASARVDSSVSFQWDEDERNAAADSWNACRAAPLQGSQPVSNRDELLPGIKPAPELDSVAKNAESLPGNSPVIGWLRSDYNSDDKRDPNAPLFMLGSNDPSETWGVKYLPLSGNSPVIPDGYVVVPKRLTAENGAKFLLVGEFSETKFINCTECFGDDECETCDGSGRIEISVPVSWTNIKAIWAKGVEHFAAAPKQETL